MYKLLILIMQLEKLFQANFVGGNHLKARHIGCCRIQTINIVISLDEKGVVYAELLNHRGAVVYAYRFVNIQTRDVNSASKQ